MTSIADIATHLRQIADGLDELVATLTDEEIVMLLSEARCPGCPHREVFHDQDRCLLNGCRCTPGILYEEWE